MKNLAVALSARRRGGDRAEKPSLREMLPDKELVHA
jgi:hypothetical protein